MPTLNDVAPSEWLKWQSFKPGEEKTLTIKKWSPDVFKQQDGKERRSVYFEFEETPSKFGIVNKANENALNEIFGAGYDLDSLIGKKITLFVDSWRSAKGEDQSGIRIRKPAGGNGHISADPRVALRDELKAARENAKKRGVAVREIKTSDVMAMMAEQLTEEIAQTNALIPF